MFGTAVTAAGRTGTDTALVQQRIREAIRAQREGWIWLLALVAAAVSIVGAIANWSAVRLSQRALDLNQRVSERTLEMSQRALDLNQRAWLLATSAKLEVRKDGVLVIMITFKNLGKSPAFDVRHNVGITGVHATPD